MMTMPAIMADELGKYVANDFRRWFGSSWLGFDADFFKGFALSEDEVKRDLEYYERAAGA